mmetsp:Transcript_11720/g.17756  ORF Transcript_11720/g.17756 Transcript_11720/m.17756 type:complete len:400 (+) Transcript_11720:228-1427(+)
MMATCTVNEPSIGKVYQNSSHATVVNPTVANDTKEDKGSPVVLSSFWIDKPAIFAPMYHYETDYYRSQLEKWPLRAIWSNMSDTSVNILETPQRLKALRKAAADETISILRTGVYKKGNGEEVNILNDIRLSISSSVCYPPDAEIFSAEDIKPRYATTMLEVRNMTTLQACRDLWNRYGGEVGCLCFASGKNPGGAFLGGSDGQEESIARSSSYYHCVIRDPSLYEFNRVNKDPFQSDHLIVAPHMPVFRQDTSPYSVIDPWYLTAISAPAVNASLVRERRVPQGEERIQQRMRARVRRILTAAYAYGVRNLVLGEYGCGSLGNDPNEIALYFREELMLPTSRFRCAFEHVVFAIHDAPSAPVGGGRPKIHCLPPFADAICPVGRTIVIQRDGSRPHYI